MIYDYVVIGAGVSGLTSAVTLAKNGYRVALVEKSKKTGPLLRGFRRKGVFFDTGFHHTGGLGEGGILETYFRYLGIFDRIEKKSYDPECSDIFRSLDPPFEFRWPTGYSRIQKGLHEAFPREKGAIDKYLDAIQQQCAAIPYLNLEADFGALQVLQSVHGPSLKEVLDELTDNDELKGVLSTHCLLNGVSPEEQAFSDYAYIAGPYYDSIHRVNGGGSKIIEAFDHALSDNGVHVYSGQSTEEILFSSDGRLKGVRLKDETILETKGSICTIHPLDFLRIVPNSVFRPAYVKRLQNLQETPSAFILYGEYDSSSNRFCEANIYQMLCPGLISFNIGGAIEERPFHITSAGYRNTESKEKGFIAICPASIEETGQWIDSFTGRRPEDYQIFKQKLAGRMKRHIEACHEEFRGRIKIIDLSTPLTIRDFANSPFGSLYGAKHRIEQYNPLPLTRVPNLFLAGQSIVAPGILGAIVSGMIVCGSIMGHEALRKELKKCI
jgi:all-trans-retinol 13,14-reductase